MRCLHKMGVVCSIKQIHNTTEESHRPDVMNPCRALFFVVGRCVPPSLIMLGTLSLPAQSFLFNFCFHAVHMPPSTCSNAQSTPMKQTRQKKIINVYHLTQASLHTIRPPPPRMPAACAFRSVQQSCWVYARHTTRFFNPAPSQCMSCSHLERQQPAPFVQCSAKVVGLCTASSTSSQPMPATGPDQMSAHPNQECQLPEPFCSVQRK